MVMLTSAYIEHLLNEKGGGKQKIRSQSISHYNELRMVENKLRI